MPVWHAYVVPKAGLLESLRPISFDAKSEIGSMVRRLKRG